MDYKKFKSMFFRHWLSFPFIWMMLFPLVLLDLFLEVYHRICFYLYGIQYVTRSLYIRIDRQKLSYLPLHDKINCMYCGYANGLLPYASKIAAETEKYWCGIKHEKSDGFIEPEHHKDFLEFGDAEGFEELDRK